MRILYSHRTKSADGQYVHIRALTDAFRAKGHALCLVGPDGVQDRADRDLSAADGRSETPKRTVRLPRALLEPAEFGYSLPAYGRLARAHAQFKPDVLYERYNLFFHAGLWLKRKTDLPFILEVNAPLMEERARHGGLAWSALARHSEQTLWRSADLVLPVTGVLAEKVIAAGADPARVHVIQNGVHESLLAPHDGKKIRIRHGVDDRLVLGFTGFVRDWHGVDRVLDFMAAEPHHNAHLLLVGDGPARSALEAKADHLGLTDRMTVTGTVQREDVADTVSAFDVALQPAVVAYASPLKLFEYMALGKPILAPSTDNILEILTHDRDGQLFDPEAATGFHQGLRLLCEDKNRRDRLGHAARKTIETRGYLWSQNASRIEDLVSTLSE
ncbi:MAG: glycosyltransferase family 4 protein [Pseudomonadota bacterium]